MSTGEPIFQGTIGTTVATSTPWWPPSNIPAPGSPNVVVVVFDDTGFAHFGCYGSSIATPNIDRLAAGGLRYTNFHTTALCSPTRASLLTGRNHHAVGMRAISNMDTGFPNMRGAVPRSAATLAEVLHEHGWATFAVGKWHLAPMVESTAAGPYDNWPLRRGFDRYYGFLQGETDQFHPELTHDHHFIDPPGRPEDGYHLTEDLVDRAIGFVRDQKSLVPERPFFLYLAFGATHAPHQAPAEYIEKYRGRFDAGWDVIRGEWFARQKELGIIGPDTTLPPSNPGVRPWDDLSEDEKAFAVRLQEAFAGFLEHTDHHLGRLVSFLEELGEMENTLFLLLSDNGASQEGGATGTLHELRYFNGLAEDPAEAVRHLDEIGGPSAHTNYPWGWAQAGNTPFRWYKQNTHGGGVRDPLVVHWPTRIKEGGAVRRQFHHVTDVFPTVLELIGAQAPRTLNGIDQMPVHGTSFAYTLDEPGTPTRKDTQYFEMFGHRGIWHRGWKAVARHDPRNSFEADRWELYNLDEDVNETVDLATERPEKLRELVDLWWTEAGRNGVLPLDDRGAAQLFRIRSRPGTPVARDVFVYYPPISHVPADACPATAKRSWTITAEVERDSEGQEGAIVSRGTLTSGYVLYIKDNRLVFDYNPIGDHTKVVSEERLPPGPVTIAARVIRTGDGADVILEAGGKEIGRGTIPRLLAMIATLGMDVGRSVIPVNDDYDPPFAFAGRIRRVVIDVPRARGPEASEESRVAGRAAMGRQ